MRTDVNVGGALVQDKLFFNVGGFYRVDNGIGKQVSKPMMVDRSE
jgi:hypothetical protein